MQLSRIWVIIILMSTAVIGSAVIQMYWIRNTINENERKFSLSVQEALAQVATALERDEHNGIAEKKTLSQQSQSSFQRRFSLSQSMSIGRVDSIGLTQNWKERLQDENALRRILNGYPIEERFSKEKLSTYLSSALMNRGIRSDYLYAVYDNEKDCIVVRDGFYIACNDSDQSSQANVDLREKKYKYQANLFVSGYGPAGALLVNFPNESSVLWKNLFRSVLASLLFMLMILMCFGYTIYVILRQKKIGEMKTDFVNNMTHEFKTPIATISLATDSIQSKKVINDPDRIKRFAGIIKEENKRMLSQVEKVLQMALLDKKDFEIKRTEIDLNDIVRTAAEHIELTVIQREGSVQVFCESQNPYITGDLTHISNIIHNLLDNANKYSPEKPEIKITTRDLPTAVEVEIEDKGIGLSKEARKLIFEKFYRVPTGNRHDIKGFGLGLSYVKAMVDAHNGKVEVKSELGKGSSFILQFPR